LHKLTEKIMGFTHPKRVFEMDSIIVSEIEKMRDEIREQHHAFRDGYWSKSLDAILGLYEKGMHYQCGNCGKMNSEPHCKCAEKKEEFHPCCGMKKNAETPVQETKECNNNVDTCKHIRYPESYKYCPNCGERIIDGSESNRCKD
jgi:hypothetical protein